MDATKRRARVSARRRAIARRSAWRPPERATTDHVQVEVEDALTRTGAAIHREAEILPAVGARDLYGDTMEVADQRVVLRGTSATSRCAGES
jgi:hypothetical protein